MVNDEMIWMEALVSRNNVAHAYNEAIALDIVNATKDKYFQMFCDLKEQLEKDWVSF